MRFENQTFTTEVTLDYNEFVDCVFKECAVVSHGGPFSLVRTKLDRVRFGVAGPAQQTIAFLQLVRSNGEELFEQLMKASPPAMPEQRAAIN